jgi:transcriptional regulator with XRE-family HTH domain
MARVKKCREIPESAPLGRVLAVLRAALDLTQSDLARLSGVKRSSISEYERGKSTPDAVTLKRLLAATGFRWPRSRIGERHVVCGPVGRGDGARTVTENALEGVGALSNQPGPVTVDRAGNELQAGAPKSFTPAELAGRVRSEGAAATVQIRGKEKVSRARAFWGTILTYVRKVVPR